MAKGFFLLTSKPTLFACNVKEEELGPLTKGERSGKTGEQVAKVEEYCKKRLASKAVIVSAQIESELVDLPEAEGKEYLAGLGVKESGVGALIRATYELLGLRTYLTTGPKESRAWTIHAGDRAPQAAGVIHTERRASRWLKWRSIVRSPTLQEFTRYDAYFDFTNLINLPRFTEMVTVDWYLCLS